MGFPRTGNGFPLRGGIPFSPQGNGFFSDRGDFAFSRRGKSVPALTGGEMPARMLAGSLQHRRGGTIPGPCRGRQSCRILESGLLHPPQAALRRFPPIFSFWMRQKEKTGRARSKREKPLKLNIRGISIRGARRESPSGPVYISARDGGFELLCGGGCGRRAAVSRIFRALVEASSSPGPSSFVLRLPQDIPRLSSFVPRLQGECSRGDRSPLLTSGRGKGAQWSRRRRRLRNEADFPTPRDRNPLLIGSGGNGTEWMPPHRGGVMEWNFRRRYGWRGQVAVRRQYTSESCGQLTRRHQLSK